MKILELNHYSLHHLKDAELQNTNGGDLPWGWGILYWVADNWDDIKSGAQDALKVVRQSINVKA